MPREETGECTLIHDGIVCSIGDVHQGGSDVHRCRWVSRGSGDTCHRPCKIKGGCTSANVMDKCISVRAVATNFCCVVLNEHVLSVPCAHSAKHSVLVPGVIGQLVRVASIPGFKLVPELSLAYEGTNRHKLGHATCVNADAFGGSRELVICIGSGHMRGLSIHCGW